MMVVEAPPLLSPQIMIYSITLTVSDKFLFLSRVIQPRHLSGHLTPQEHAYCNTACVQSFPVFFLLNGLLLWTLVSAYIHSKVLKLQILQNHKLFILCFINIPQIGGVCLAIHVTACTCSSVIMYVCNSAVERGCNDIGLCDTLLFASDILWY